MDTFQIIAWVVTIAISLIGAGVVAKIVGKTAQAADVAQQLMELLSKTAQALNDGVLTAQEVAEIYQEAKDVRDALDRLIRTAKINAVRMGKIGKIGDKL